MPAFDLHAHAVPAAALSSLRRSHPRLAPVSRQVPGGWVLEYPAGHVLGPLPEGLVDLGARLADMDRSLVDVQAVSSPPSNFFQGAEPAAAAEAVGVLNDGLIDLARQAGGRVRVIAGLPMQDPAAAAAEVHRVAASPEVVGAVVGTHIAGADLDTPALAPVWAAMAVEGLFLQVHPHRPTDAQRLSRWNLANALGNPIETTTAATALLLGGVLDAHPALRVVLVHGGGFLPYQFGRLRRSVAVRPPEGRVGGLPADALERFHYDSLTHDPAALRHLVTCVGAERVVLGSDYPFEMGDPDPRRALVAALGVEAAGRIAGASGEALLTRTPA